MKTRLISISIILLSVVFTSCKKDDPEAEGPAVSIQQAIEGVNRLAVPISSPNPTASSSELAALDNTLGGARIVGMGEATHGTKEFFQMKDRLFRYLVTQHGHKAMAFEESFGASVYINRYIRDGIGDPKTYLGWPWKTQEVVTMIEWMRTYNKQQSEENKLSFYGIDMQDPTQELQLLAEYLETVEPAWSDQFIQLLEPFVNALANQDYASETASVRDQVRANLTTIRNHIQSRQNAYVAASSQRDFEEMLQAATVLLQTEELMRETDFAKTYNKRDVFMSSNIDWIANRISNSSKMSIWAHNGHVENIVEDNVSAITAMGHHLKQTYGEAYKIISFGFSKGSVNAFDLNETLKAHTITREPPAGSYNAIFNQANAKNFILDLSSIPADTELNRLVSQRRSFFEFGAVYDDSLYSDAFILKFLDNASDVLIYFDESTPTTLLP